MFCYQCEQTAGCKGCAGSQGVCGKQPDTATAQDLLNEVAKGVAWLAQKSSAQNSKVNEFLVDALFTTVTNVNFDTEKVAKLAAYGAQLRSELGAVPPESPVCAGVSVPATAIDAAVEGEKYSIAKRKEKYGDTVAGLQELIFYGLKGAAAYIHHARMLGYEDNNIYSKQTEILAFLAEEPTDVNALLGNALATGELNFKAMEILDKANTTAYGHPEPTEVLVTPVAGKCILVSGHDLKDLKTLLEQTEGKGINIYTHGEMLPCLAYPELKKYSHLVGNYGGAWQDQVKEFAAFPGAILMTTNCIQKPTENYMGRIFTTGLVEWPGVTHIDDNKDFTPVIEAALAAEGFAANEPEKKITIGFARNTVLSVAPAVIDAVKSGAIKHFFLIGGCDGAKPGRNYYTDFAQQVPQDCVILTLACGKFRFNKMDFGTIGGIPRLLDIGQCNDAYSAVQIAVALAGAFECGVNDLPLSLVLSWYEQKAVAILLTLLHLGIKNIRLGPTLPAFVTPDALQVLVDKFQIAPVTTPEQDLATILG